MENKQSKLLEQAREILTRLASAGWVKVFLQHGLNIEARDLKSELRRFLPGINRECPGFDDYAIKGKCGIEPGKPALSLLYHGFASPNVAGYNDSGSLVEISEYPTPGDLEVLENLVYGLEPFSLEDIRAQVNGAGLAIVVYAKEYRIAGNTVHLKHADMCYSRTGVARVGTSEALYLSDARGYMPEDGMDEKKLRVLPCRYAAYITTCVTGDELVHSSRFVPNEERTEVADANRRFRVPVHKLFSGSECLSGHDFNVQLTANHVNEKLRRVHLRFKELGHDESGWNEPDLSNPPFCFYEGIAEFSQSGDDGPGLLIPTVHESLVAIATYKKQGEVEEQTLTYNVPKSKLAGTGVLSSSVWIYPKRDGSRSAPEYVHARFAVDYEGDKVKNLNECEDVAGIVKKGGYEAQHILDFTGDGWIEVSGCPSLDPEELPRHAACSLVTPPDYFAKVKQSGLMQSLPPSMRQTIWPGHGGSPKALSDQRYAANIELERARFDKGDKTMTAIVGQLNIKGGGSPRGFAPQSLRNSMLPDAAAGVFAPGWDVSIDRNEDNIYFFSTHGLGSPFPEDAKLCAALSAYWPAASPDVTRTFNPNSAPGLRYPTVTPLLDSTIGQDDNQPWDGIQGPKIDETKKIIEYTNIDYGDYVHGSLNNKFLANVIGDIDHKEYIARTVAMARVYQSLEATTTADKAKYAVYSFKHTDPENDKDLQAALMKTGASLESGYSYRFAVFEPKPVEDDTGKPFDKVWVSYEKMLILYADSVTVLKKNCRGEWSATPFKD